MVAPARYYVQYNKGIWTLKIIGEKSLLSRLQMTAYYVLHTN